MEAPIKECDFDLIGHQKKVSVFKWNPTVEQTIASASADLTIKVWDINNEQDVFTYQDLGDNPWCIEWNWNGSMVGSATKGKKIHVLDPRKKEAAMVADAHLNSKG